MVMKRGHLPHRMNCAGARRDTTWVILCSGDCPLLAAGFYQVVLVRVGGGRGT